MNARTTHNALENIGRMVKIVRRHGLDRELDVRKCVEPFLVVGVLWKALGKLRSRAELEIEGVISLRAGPVAPLAAGVEAPDNHVEGVKDVKKGCEFLASPPRSQNTIAGIHIHHLIPRRSVNSFFFIARHSVNTESLNQIFMET